MLENTVEKGEITSNFSFSYSVFNRLALQTLKNEGLFGKGLTLNVIRHLLYFQAFAFFLGSVVKSPRLSSTLFQSYSILSFLTGAYIALDGLFHLSIKIYQTIIFMQRIQFFPNQLVDDKMAM